MYRWRSVTFGSWFGWPDIGSALSVQLNGQSKLYLLQTFVWYLRFSLLWISTLLHSGMWRRAIWKSGNNILRKSSVVHLAVFCCKVFRNLNFYQDVRHHVREDSNFHWWEFLRITQRTDFWKSKSVVEKWKQQYARADCLNVVIERVQDYCGLWWPSCKVEVSNILSKSVRIYLEETLSVPTFSAKSHSFIVLCKPRHIAVKFQTFSAPLRPVGPSALASYLNVIGNHAPGCNTAWVWV